MGARTWHRPRALAVVSSIVGIAFFIWLGLWQLRRAHEKEALFAAFDATATQPVVTLDVARREATPLHYPLVQVAGRYDPVHAYVLDNQVREGRAGVMVFDVFEPAAGGPPLLANRGFLARGERGERPPIPAVPEGAQTLTALYAPPPGSGLHLGGDALPRQTTWPKLSIYIDLAEIAKDLGREPDPRVLLLMPETDAAAAPAFVREWRPEVFPPERHYGYAFTWFTFAALVVAIFTILHWRKDEV